MASFIHVRDSDNIVVAVFSTTQTPAVGVTEFNENHPVFIPPISINQWERTGVDTFVDNGPITGVPDVSLRTHNGAIFLVIEDGTENAIWGEPANNIGINMFRAGEVIGMSVVMNRSREFGTAEFHMTVDGVLQSAETFFIDGTDTISNSIEYVTPITFAANQFVSISSVNVGYKGDSGTGTVVFWYRDAV